MGGSYNNGSGSNMPMRYADDVYEDEYPPQDQQYNRYNDGGMAGVGVVGLGRSTSSGGEMRENYNEHNNGHPGGAEGGWGPGGVPSRNPSQMDRSTSSQPQISPRLQQQQQYYQGQYPQQPLQNPYDQQQQQQQQSYDQQQHYAQHDPTMALPPRPFEAAVSAASPTPSHRSMPGLGAVYNQSGAVEGEEEDARRPLRVTNEEEHLEEEEGDEDAYAGMNEVMTSPH